VRTLPRKYQGLKIVRLVKTDVTACGAYIKKSEPSGSDFLFDVDYLILGLNQIVSLKGFPLSIESNPPL
jgi:hypothetical protein